MARSTHSSLEPLEARIAPASLAIYHPPIDIVPSMGQTTSTVDLANAFDSDTAAGYRTHVVFTTNYDTDPNTPGLQAGKITLELFNDTAPLSVANFISYVEGVGHGGYTGTYFHRSVPGFILQGGGYSDTNLTQAIVKGPAVHNEFDSSDADRSNTLGTVAYAKSPGDPNSATSEFFFNLGNNSATLDPQNGGFTVFAKVVSGMDVVNAIANLPTDAIGVTAGATDGGGTPYQNGYQTSAAQNGGKLPSVNQLVDIVSAQVIPPKHSVVAGITYSGLQIIDDATGLPTSLVTGKLSGENLGLNYANAASGNYTISATATSGTSSVVEQFQLAVHPNLVGSAVSDSLYTNFQTGDTATESVKITNTGGGISKGPVTVSYFLNPTDSSNSGGPIALGSETASLNLASGKSLTLTKSFSVDPSLGLITGNYQLTAQISAAGPAGGNPQDADYYTDDNTVTGAAHHFISGTHTSELQALSETDSLLAILVPGDTGLAKLSVANASQTAAHGKVDVQFYLSSNSTLDTTKDTLVGSASNLQLDLAPGKTGTLSAAVTVPTDLSLTQSGTLYHIFGVVTPSATGGAGDSLATDNSVAGNLHFLEHEFGTFSVSSSAGIARRVNAPLTYLDSAHDKVTVKITGAGFGSAELDADKGLLWEVDGTTLGSTLTALVSLPTGTTGSTAPHTVVKDILVGASTGSAIGNLALGQVDWTDSVDLLGGAARVTLGNSSGSGDHVLGLGTAGGTAALKAAVTLGTVQDTSLTSAQPLSALTAATWLSVNGDTQTIQAPSIDYLTVPGDLTANLTIGPGASATAVVLKSLTVGGSLHGSQAFIAGSVGAVKLGAMQDSEFVAGGSQVPQGAHNLTAGTSIGSFTVTNALDASDIAALAFSKISLGSVVAHASAPNFGVIAETIAAYQRGTTSISDLSGAQTPSATVDQQQNYQVTLLDPAS